MSNAEIAKLLKAWPQVESVLRVPRNERDYRSLVKLLDASLMEVLGTLIDNYEGERVSELA
jgi:hypothetical protein